ncbi:MAG: hypothetical protein EP301_07270 [Gammaproteobacteria bacterium]|jgi:hypothetical protein|nr:MAG: hypothetical protein EP301_07270 [Gammaproteobacteria bacterium]
MSDNEFELRFAEILDDIETRSCVADSFVDRDLYRLYLATLWANIVLNPDDVGLSEAHLEPLHDYLNERASRVLGEDGSLTECFRFVNSKAGEQAMQSAQLNQTHRELLLYFASMILDPDGHKRWMDMVLESDVEGRGSRR